MNTNSTRNEMQLDFDFGSMFFGSRCVLGQLLVVNVGPTFAIVGPTIENVGQPKTAKLLSF